MQCTTEHSGSAYNGACVPGPPMPPTTSSPSQTEQQLSGQAGSHAATHKGGSHAHTTHLWRCAKAGQRDAAAGGGPCGTPPTPKHRLPALVSVSATTNPQTNPSNGTSHNRLVRQPLLFFSCGYRTPLLCGHCLLVAGRCTAHRPPFTKCCPHQLHQPHCTALGLVLPSPAHRAMRRCTHMLCAGQSTPSVAKAVRWLCCLPHARTHWPKAVATMWAHGCVCMGGCFTLPWRAAGVRSAA